MTITMNYRKIISFILFCVFQTALVAQNNISVKSKQHPNDLGNPDLLIAPPSGAKGYPSRASELDVLPGFKNPPVGYGEVPFWWWSGDTLDKERTYRVVTVDYLYTHPQFQNSLGKGANVIYDGLHLDAVIDYVRDHSPVAPQVEGRIRVK